MEPDELTWVDSVPMPQARGKRIRIGEAEWSREGSGVDGPAVLTAKFSINATDVMAILVEDITSAHQHATGRATDAPRPRLRIGNRSYTLYVEAPAQSPTA